VKGETFNIIRTSFSVSLSLSLSLSGLLSVFLHGIYCGPINLDGMCSREYPETQTHIVFFSLVCASCIYKVETPL